MDLTVRTGMTMGEALASARAQSEERRAAGFDQAALDAAARQGFAAGAFEESEEEGAAVVEEFYPYSLEVEARDDGSSEPAQAGRTALAEKLREKAARSASSAGVANSA